MTIYSDYPRRRARQIAADAVALTIIAAGIWISVAAVSAVAGLSEVGRRLEFAGAGFEAALGAAAKALGQVPFVGEAVRGPFDSAGSAGSLLKEAGQTTQSTGVAAAIVLGVLAGAVIVAGAYGLWLRPRARFVRRASQARALAALADGRDLLALRALIGGSAKKISGVCAHPAESWRSGEPAALEALAGLELREAGVRVAG